MRDFKQSLKEIANNKEEILKKGTFHLVNEINTDNDIVHGALTYNSSLHEWQLTQMSEDGYFEYFIQEVMESFSRAFGGFISYVNKQMIVGTDFQFYADSSTFKVKRVNINEFDINFIAPEHDTLVLQALGYAVKIERNKVIPEFFLSSKGGIGWKCPNCGNLLTMSVTRCVYCQRERMKLVEVHSGKNSY